MLIGEVDQNQNGIIETEEFLQVKQENISWSVFFLIYFL